MAPSLIIAHEIDEASPLHNVTPEDIVAADGAIFVSVSATDDNSKQVTGAILKGLLAAGLLSHTSTPLAITLLR